MNAELRNSAERLRGHVEVMATQIGERHSRQKGSLEAAAGYIERSFSDMGFNPVSEIYSDKLYRNVVVNHYGTERRNEILIIGAHYDTVLLSPGADDNASGVSVLLELARHLRDKRYSRTIRFVAFANEEWPFFGRDEMGSRVHAENARQRNEQIIGMLSLEMLGIYSSAEKSQRYPKPLNYFYPDKANFLAFVSNIPSRNLLKEVITEFRRSEQFPSEGLIAPRFLVPDIRRSDNYSFWSFGFPAIMVTDTANYRSRTYHRATDVASNLDYESMSRVTAGLVESIRALAGP